MATIKVFNDIFEDKSEEFIYDTARPLLEQVEEHLDKEIYKTTLVECYDPQTGETFFAPMEDDNESEGVIIVVNGQSVDKDYIPEEHDIVNVIFTPLGDSLSSNSTRGLIIGVGVGLLLGLITGGVGFAVWGWEALGVGLAGLAGATVGGLVGWSIGKYIDDHQQGKAGNRFNGKESNQLPDVRGCSNQALVGNNFPTVIGKHLVAPFVIANPYTEYSGERGADAYIREVLCVGYAPLCLTDFKLGDYMLAYNRTHISDEHTVGNEPMLAGLLKGYSTQYADDGDIVDFWSKNDVEIEILQQPVSGSGIGYGSIYPYVMKEQQIDANSFYIADKELQDNVPVSYKGVSFPNKYKTNTVIFTDACPMEFTINLDFPSGLFASYNYTSESVSETRYASIPLWMCIQWRIHNDNNAESKADASDFDSWNTVNFGTYNQQFTAFNALGDKIAHKGNDFGVGTLEDIYGTFFTNLRTIQNFGALSGEDGVSEMRVSAKVTLTKAQCLDIISDDNPARVVEIRVLRVSPNYMNELSDEHSEEGESPYSYSDLVKVSTVVTKIFDEEELQKNNNLTPVPICSESDLNKLCLVAVKAKADASGFIQNNFDKISCIATSFSPFWDIDTKKIKPEGVHKETKYYGYFVGNTDTRTNRTNDATEREVTKTEYEQARHDGYNWYREKAGSNFGTLIKGIVFDSPVTHNECPAWYVASQAAPYYKGNYSQMASSGFLLACFGVHNGPEAMGEEDINVLAVADWAEKTFSLKDGSTFTRTTKYNGVTYQSGDLVPLRMEASGYLYSGIKIEDLLQRLAFCGRATWVVDETGKIKPVFDGPVDYTKGAIASENCITSSNAYNYEDPPAGLFITFNDENDGYENNSFYVWSDGNSLKNHHGTVEQFSADFVTNPFQMHSLARYTLACRVLNKEVLTRKIGPGGAIYTLGDVVLVQGEDLLIGDVSGRVQEVIQDDNKIYGFISDAVYEYTGETSGGVSTQGVTVIQNRYHGASNAVTIALSAPTTITVGNKTYTLQPGQTNLVLFAPVNGVYGLPIGDDDPSPTTNKKYKMQTGDIVMFGMVDRISAPYKIIKIKPEANGCFTETLIPYNEQLYNYGAALPTFQTYITPPKVAVDPAAVSDVPQTQADLNKTLQTVYSAIGVVKDTTPPATPTAISAIASKDYINITWAQTNPGKVKYTIIEISRDGGTNWATAARVDADNWKYYFSRSIDGYPEVDSSAAHTLANYKFRLTSVSTFDVPSTTSSAQSVNDTNYGTWKPAVPSFISKIPTQGGIDFIWNTPSTSVSGRQLYGNNTFVLTVKYNGTTRQTITTSATKASYNFVRGVDGYPEKVHTSDAPGLDLYTFDLRVFNESGEYREITGVTFNSATETINYGTWTPYIASNYFLTKDAEQDGISIAWKSADGNGSELYGGVKYTVNLYYNNVLRTSVNTDSLQMFYVFDRSTDGYPEVGAHVETGDTDLALYTLTITATSSIDGLSDRTTTSSATSITTSGYKTWKIPTMSVQSEVLDRTAILTAIYTGSDIYGTPQLMARIKRRGNLDVVNGQTFNAYLGITEDSQYYEPEFEESPQPSSTSNTELNYRKASSSLFFKSNSNKITHTLPLLGQTPRLFDSSDQFIGKFSYEAIDVPVIVESSTEPQSAVANELLYYTGTTTSDLENGKWYLYDGTEEEWVEVAADTLIHYVSSVTVTGFEENKYYIYSTSWTELLSKTVFVPTIYKYELQLTNESGNVSNTVEREITALCTSISDLVHSHEHYKELYVEKLSAISANLGMISQGGMGAYDPNRGNYWFLSRMSPEDSGVAGGVEKGAFRVGGEEEYFKVTPLGEDKYAIELKAGNITLTSQGDGTSFKQGTYIYDSDDPHKRLALTPTGIIAQKETNEGTEQTPNWVWNNVANVNIDSNGNLILSNATGANQVKYGFVVENADIYHLENDTLDESDANPQGLTFDGGLKNITLDIKPLLDMNNSTRCYEGTITKSVSSYTGSVVVLSKSKMLVHGATTNRKGININGTINDIQDSYASNNQVMRESSTIQSGKTVGEYLGLSSSQVNKGIWY